MKRIPSLAIPTTRVRYSKQSQGLSKSVKISLNSRPETKSRGLPVAALIRCCLFVPVCSHSPFSVSPFLDPPLSHGSVEPRHFIHQRSLVSSTVTSDSQPSKEGHASPAAHLRTGEISVHSSPGLQQRSQRQSEELKDEYFDELNNFHYECNELTDNYHEYEQGQGQIIVKGRLKSRIAYWKEIGAYDFILDTIENGYKIPFFSTPTPVILKNNRSALDHKSFVEQAIHDLLIRGLVVECSNVPYVVNPITVSVQNNGKKRLILDLRHVNKHLWKSKVKFEDIRVAMQYISIGSYFFKFDLHSAYHHLDIFEGHTQFLGFSWNFEGSVKYFKFKVLPFGLSSACYIFTKLTRPLIKKWRGEGKQVLMYLDDGLGVHNDYTSCHRMALEMKDDLLKCGFVPKNEKSMWLPSKQKTFLGYFIDTESGKIKIPYSRLEKLSNCIQGVERTLADKGSAHVRTVASLVGQIISMHYVLGDIVYLMTKSISIDVQKAVSWNSYIVLSKDSLSMIQFWKKNLNSLNEKAFITDFACHTIAYSDASGTGFGGYVVETPINIAHGMWSEDERLLSSTWRELMAVKRVLMSLRGRLANKHVKWFSDNQNVIRIVQRGSMKPALLDIALSIFEFCLMSNIRLDINWIPRAENQQADFLSKIVDFDDWGVSNEIFHYLDSLWGPHEIDFFADIQIINYQYFTPDFGHPMQSGLTLLRLIGMVSMGGLFHQYV